MAYNSAAAEARTASRLLWHRIAFSPKAWCILAVNLAAVVMVVAGLLYLNFYRSSLIEDKITILTTQGELIAVALGESIVSDTDEDGVHGIDAAAAAGITAVIQPGGSMRDDEVIAAANEANIAMVFTGVRHFRH